MSGGIGNVQLSSVDSSVSWREIGLHSAVVRALSSSLALALADTTPETDDLCSRLCALQMFFTFLGICCFGAVAGFQSKWEIGVCE